MKSKIVKNAVVQSTIFNVILLIIFVLLWLNYVYPKFIEIEKLKSEVVEEYNYGKKIEKDWIDYKKFKSLSSSIWKKELEWNVYLQNILKEFKEEEFNFHFWNNSSNNYTIFLKNKSSDIAKEKVDFENKWVNKKIENIIPYYTGDSKLWENALTDFKFINYLENLLDKFDLKYTNTIWIGNLTLEESFNSSFNKKSKIDDSLGVKIYYFPLKLNLKWDKRYIVDFLHYIENVGKINYDDWEISVFKENPNDLAFGNMKKYFYPEKDFYNNLFFDIKNVSFSEYIDSSEEKMWEEYYINNNLWWFIKKVQWFEEYSVDLDLRFYVKWMPLFKMKLYVNDVQKKYNNLLKVSNVWMQYILKNKSNLRNFSEIKAMRNFKNFNTYLLSLKNEINLMKKGLNKSWWLWGVYLKSKEYDKIFNIINSSIKNDLKVLSKEEFEKNKKYLWVKEKVKNN